MEAAALALSQGDNQPALTAFHPWRLDDIVLDALVAQCQDHPAGTAWVLEQLRTSGERVHELEREAWRRVSYRVQPEADALTASLWAQWLAGNPWSLREEWDALYLKPVCAAFRGVLEARHLPPDVRDRCMRDLREAFYFMLLGGGDAPPGWAELAVRTLETAPPGPVDALAALLDEGGWQRVASAATTRGRWADAAALRWPDRPRPARAVALARSFSAQPTALEAGLDLHVVLRLLESWRDPLRRSPERSWSVVTQNRGRARGRLRAVLMDPLPPAASDALLALPALHARTVAAARRYAWSWAWQQVSADFAFDAARPVTPPCVDAADGLPSLPPTSQAMLRSWVILVIFKGRLGHLQRWVRTGGTGDRDSTWARLLAEDLPPVLRDPTSVARRTAGYDRVRTDLADTLQEHLAASIPLLEAALKLAPGRGLRARYEAIFGPIWAPEVPLPRSGFPTFSQNIHAAIDHLHATQADPCEP